jgi:tyrosine-protein kinase Etk/Wzc
LEDSEKKFNQFREQHNTVDVTQESELLLKQNIQLETMQLNYNRNKLSWLQNTRLTIH